MTRERTGMIIRLVAGIALGALLGFLYFRFVGCRTGACPITSNPFASIVFGALLGGLMAWGV